MIGPCCPGKPTAKRLRIGNQMVGIANLDAVIDGALNLTDASDDELKAILLAGVEEHNYVPSEMEDEYIAAIWEEFLRRRSSKPSCSCGCKK
jgi:hypothetical protein